MTQILEPKPRLRRLKQTPVCAPCCIQGAGVHKINQCDKTRGIRDSLLRRLMVFSGLTLGATTIAGFSVGPAAGFAFLCGYAVFLVVGSIAGPRGVIIATGVYSALTVAYAARGAFL